MNIEILNKKFGIPGRIDFSTGKGMLPIVEMKSGDIEDIVFIYGSHIVSFRLKEQPDILWMSDSSTFEKGKPIRGGIPICFPWFGPHVSDPQKPLHGFARISNWDVTRTGILKNGDVQLQLTLKDSPQTRKLWPYSFQNDLTITVGNSLSISLSCQNTGKAVFTYADALHTYFSVSDIDNVRLHGFKGYKYYDGLENGAIKTQTEEVLIIQKEESRRYFEFTDDCIIEDLGFSRKIHIKKYGSRVTLIWNPWSETAKKIPDMPDDGYKKMLCVESVNSNDNVITLKPGEKHTLTTTINVERLS